ncbi:hypothetical protein HJ590_12100 [Naumannella sp. ID2617S]|nr:hypothetical protein [Naumannella sp. ID2617S]
MTDLAAYLGVEPSGFVAECTAEADALVTQRVGQATVPASVRARAVLEVGADLWYRKQTRNGIAGFGSTETGIQPVRIARDPMAAAEPILRPWLTPGIA